LYNGKSFLFLEIVFLAKRDGQRTRTKLPEKREREPRESDEESGEESKSKSKSKFSEKRERERRESESDEESVEKLDVGIPLRHYSKYCDVSVVIVPLFCYSCSTVIQY
jgi:hypothetical protein